MSKDRETIEILKEIRDCLCGKTKKSINEIRKEMGLEEFPKKIYLKPLEALTKLINGELKKITYDDNFYFEIDDFGYLLCVDIKTSNTIDIKPSIIFKNYWWAVE